MWPGAFSVTWNWDVYVYGGSGDTVYSDHPVTTGQGHCAGATVPCYNSDTGQSYPYNAISATQSNNPTCCHFIWNDTITSEQPGGIIGKFGLGCAGITTASVVMSIPAILCKESPILIDAYGEGFHLSDVAHGVQFREYAHSPATQMSWTDPKYHNGWLALPKHGAVTSLAELFGNLSPQPPSKTPNGYKALAYFASEQGCGTYAEPLKTLSGANCPAAWKQLRIWIDANHDGISQPSELHTLDELGIKEILLEYRDSKFTDKFGNQFRYVSDIVDKAGTKANRCYDVFLLTGPPNP